MRTENVVLIIGAVVVVLLLCGPLGSGILSWGMMGPGHMWVWDGNAVVSGWGLGMMLVMGLFWIFVIALLALAVVWLARRSTASDGPVERVDDQALRILRERYARGEITKEEFDQMRRDIDE